MQAILLSNMINFGFTKTIRFRLSLIYSMMIFVVCSLFILAFNIYFNIYFTRPLQPSAVDNARSELEQVFFPDLGRKFQALENEEREQLQELRQQDLQRVQVVSVLSLIPISLFSLLFGYFVAGSFLSPLNKLNHKLDQLSGDTLSEKFDYHGSNDEIGQLINSFNKMSQRLNVEFSKQVEFVQDAAHELKTPLAVIHSNTEVIAAGLPSEKSTALEKSIENVSVGIGRLNDLIDDLLVLTEPSGKFEKLDLGSVVREVFEDIQPLAEEADIKFELSVPKEKLMGDIQPFDFTRALRNIVENAIKYSQIDNKGPKVSVAVYQENEKIVISVVDNGPGIPLSLQQRIFERFYRVDKSRQSRSGGSGLGLAIAQKIMNEHGGKIELESEPGRTEFRLVL